jgi:hypothetical protein
MASACVTECNFFVAVRRRLGKKKKADDVEGKVVVEDKEIDDGVTMRAFSYNYSEWLLMSLGVCMLLVSRDFVLNGHLAMSTNASTSQRLQFVPIAVRSRHYRAGPDGLPVARVLDSLRGSDCRHAAERR